MAPPQSPVSAQMAAPTPISVLCSGYGDLHMELGEYRPRPRCLLSFHSGMPCKDFSPGQFEGGLAKEGTLESRV